MVGGVFFLVKGEGGTKKWHVEVPREAMGQKKGASPRRAGLCLLDDGDGSDDLTFRFLDLRLAKAML